MQFHDYTTLRSMALRNPGLLASLTPERLQAYRRMSSEEVLQSMNRGLVSTLGCETAFELKRAFDRRPELLNLYNAMVRELGWLRNGRPFYNVWPIAYDLIASVTLDVPWGEVRFPYETMLFRFPRGREPHGMACALVHNYSEMLQNDKRRSTVSEFNQKAGIDDGEIGRGMICATIQKADKSLGNESLHGLNEVGDDGHDESVEETLVRLRLASPPPHIEFLYRLAIFTSLLAEGQDLITPVVLSKDRDKYEAAASEEQKRWIEDRAARIQGRGFDLGKQLQEERDSSPHWRNPHLCLFWTGAGRGSPLLKVRRGGVVIPKALSEVPTGFLGPETPEELTLAEAAYVRVPISTRVRYEILRRDSYRCQLCGKAAADGVRLHIDHKHAVSRGGTNQPENLWTLCEPCNLGKSDLSLAPDEKKPGP